MYQFRNETTLNFPDEIRELILKELGQAKKIIGTCSNYGNSTRIISSSFRSSILQAKPSRTTGNAGFTFGLAV